MIFRVDNVCCDTCGNEDVGGEPAYWEAESMLDVWKKLGKPQVVAYWCKNKYVHGVKLLKSSPIEEVWGPNPECNFQRDAGRVTAFRAATASAFALFQVQPVKVRR